MPTFLKPHRRPQRPARFCGLRRFTLAAAAVGLLLFSDAGQLRADTASVVAAADAFKATLSTSQITTLQLSYTLANARGWSNLPGGRNGLRLGDLSDAQEAAALALIQSALSETGYNLFSEIRLADEVLRAVSGNSYGFDLYNVIFIGTPSTTSPWQLQITGHHLAYNITYNGNYVSATPEFDGTEPPYYTDSSGVFHAPVEAQRAAVSALADSVQANSAAASLAKLTGTFTDVVMGATMGSGGGGGGPGGGGGTTGTSGGDTNFPATYPTGTTGRGIPYSSLSTDQQALVKAAIAAWVNTQATDVATPLLTRYTTDEALALTYVGYGAGASGAASFPARPTDLTTQRSYLRIDGPRVWIEFISQAGVVFPSNIHYHTLWRDKVADYGAEFGQSSTDDPGPTTGTVPTVSVTTPTTAPIVEGGVKAKVFFTRSGADTTAALTIGYTLAGSATNGDDYTSGGQALTGSITIPAGSTTAKIKVFALPDGVVEGTEKIKLKLSASPMGAYTKGTSNVVRLLISDAN